jgi:hypothetical protein
MQNFQCGGDTAEAYAELLAAQHSSDRGLQSKGVHDILLILTARKLLNCVKGRRCALKDMLRWLTRRRGMKEK